MNWRSIFIIARKDLRIALKNPSVSIPMIVVPLIFLLILPASAIVVPALTLPESGQLINDPDTAMLLARMPQQISVWFNGLDERQVLVMLLAGLLYAPFFLILPLMFSSVIAAEAFAGERERKTIEGLLYTPVTDAELFLGKVMAAFIPSVLITWIGFLFYTLVVNALSGIFLHWAGWFPLSPWYALIFWVSPGISLLSVAFTVLISSRNPTFMGAYQTSSALVLLVVGLMGAQMSGILYLTTWVSLGLGVLIWLAAGLLMTLSIGTFNRQSLLATLN